MHIRKYIRNILWEQFIEEDYPASFNMDEFKMLRSFNARINYSQARLKRISSGSSRIVYQIDDELVLKLARNVKGLAQNEAEVTAAEDSSLQTYGLTANIKEHSREFTWVEMELASRLTEKKFKAITGYLWTDFQKALHDYGFKVNGRKGEYHNESDLDPSIYEDMWENEFTYGVFDYIGNFAVPTRDLQRLSSWGIVQRDGDTEIVMVDYGLTKDVHSAHYAH